jgi:hypothetical protein
MRARYLGAVVACFILMLLTGCAPKEKFPIEIEEVIPGTWKPQELRKVDLDGDEEEEWLLIYRQTSVPSSKPDGPLGGVIYDAQIDISPVQPHLELPYRPAYLVPYRLLPDLRPGKGQGYLGEAGYGIETYDTDRDGKQDELVILGYIQDPNPTKGVLRVSDPSRKPKPTLVNFFRWENETVGYTLTAHFQGDGGIEVVRPRGGDRGRIEEVTVKEKLYDRSQICQKTVYRREKDEVTYQKFSGPVLDFTYGAPSQPFYPEAAVLAYYLSLAGGEGSPEDYTTGDGQVSAQNLAKAELGSVSRAKKNVVVGLTYPGSISKKDVSNVEYVDVTVNVIMDGVPMDISWQVVNISSGKLNEEVIWRLNGITSARRLVE